MSVVTESISIPHPLDQARTDRYWPTAEVIADSVSPERSRLITVEATYHRFIHAEALTYRTFSRNAGSSRAIPGNKMLAQVESNPALPVEWGKNQSGMQARELLDPEVAAKAEAVWLSARDAAVAHVRELLELGVHKQLANRLLEPFASITVIITATIESFEHMFSQRCHPDAQPEFQAMAHQVRQVIEASTPAELTWDDWHTPYIRPEDWEDPLVVERGDAAIEAIKEVSTGRSCRVSYLTHRGVRDLSDDLRLCNETLAGSDPPHASPFEHVARPKMPWEQQRGNLVGWVQYRHERLNY